MKAKLKHGDLIYLYELDSNNKIHKSILQVSTTFHSDEIKYGVFFVSDPEVGYILPESQLNKVLEDKSIHVIGERSTMELSNLFIMGLNESLTELDRKHKKQIKETEKVIAELKKMC